MKAFRSMLAVLTVVLAISAGCKKTEHLQPYDVRGVKVDVPQLDVAFAQANPEVQTDVAMFKRSFRYRQYPEALAVLGKLSGHASLTPPQKKLIEDLTAQTKEVVAKAASSVPGR